MRFRAVLMTALAFIIGLLPLVLATGAGANARIHLGFTVLGGMLAATLFGILLIPGLYVMFQGIGDKIGRTCVKSSSVSAGWKGTWPICTCSWRSSLSGSTDSPTGWSGSSGAWTLPRTCSLVGWADARRPNEAGINRCPWPEPAASAPRPAP
jgi:hypothetical protein